MSRKPRRFSAITGDGGRRSGFRAAFAVSCMIRGGSTSVAKRIFISVRRAGTNTSRERCSSGGCDTRRSNRTKSGIDTTVLFRGVAVLPMTPKQAIKNGTIFETCRILFGYFAALRSRASRLRLAIASRKRITPIKNATLFAGPHFLSSQIVRVISSSMCRRRREPRRSRLSCMK